MNAQILTLTIALMLLSLGSNAQLTSSHGTLIVYTYTDKGIVVTVDRKLTNIKDGNAIGDDTQTKIFEINNHTGIAFSGEFKMGTKLENGSTVIADYNFDGIKTVNDFMAENRDFIVNEEAVAKLTSFVKSFYDSYMRQSISLSKTYNLPFNKTCVFNLLVFGWNPLERQFKIGGIQILTKSNQTTVSKDIYNSTVVPLALNGRTDLKDELERGINPKYNHLRKNPMVQYLKHFPKFTISSALAFAKWMIAETSIEYPNDVSKEVDALLITESNAEWLLKNSVPVNDNKQ